MTLSEELAWRGFINQTTIEYIRLLDSKKQKFYHGYDASDSSLTIGNLAAIMMDKVFIRHGWQPIILAGGATSLIGDPGGKDSERSLQSADKIAQNIDGVSKQIKAIFGADVQFVNNLQWFSHMNILEFLRDVGKHFSMTALIQRDYIAKRIGEGGSGISYTEFSYTLLQGYDFLHLFREYGVELQLAGSDQWGNALSGVDLVRRVEGSEVNVLTCPLIINKATGKKFGKSEEGAIWLDPNRTSAYKMYQFWLNIDDLGVEDYLKVYTELDKPAIDRIMQEFNLDKSKRIAQKTLAYEVTKSIHGKETVDAVIRANEVLFGGSDYSNLKSSDFLALKDELPLINARIGQMVSKTLLDGGLVSSGSEFRRFIDQKAIYLNGKTLPEDKKWQKNDFLNGQYSIVRRGKNNNIIVRCV